MLGRPQEIRRIGAELDKLIGRGFVAPVVGARYPLERAREALELLDQRGATGKVVLELD
jgi:NADPH2:quinone reductase